MTSTLRYIVMPRALQATPSLLTYSARPPLDSIVEGAAIQPDEPVNVRQRYRVYGRSMDDQNRRALFTHTGYRRDRLLALAWVPIN